MSKYTIGFNANNYKRTKNDTDIPAIKNSKPRKSIVRVYFADRNMTLSYYNDLFDLHKGDWVYVDGKLEGLQGRVVDVSYTFKIKLSDYKRVIDVANTSVKGKMHVAGSHIMSFDRNVIPFEKVKTWFLAPCFEEEYAVGDEESSFPLNDLGEMKISSDIAERGNDYYLQNKVSYICVDGNVGKAIVSGRYNYIVEFNYFNGEIKNLVCSCFCSGSCKHEFAVMLQLRECLDFISDKNLGKQTDYFAAISQNVFVNYVLGGKKNGTINVNI